MFSSTDNCLKIYLRFKADQLPAYRQFPIFYTTKRVILVWVGKEEPQFWKNKIKQSNFSPISDGRFDDSNAYFATK
jgi:hypothetical protein